ncbi:YolD-like family protein [Halobacillus sp. SY10]|uniref:YolD-like family protein n=1 Tax=Halobacillus sp. SY10 TaxID=3381356 RepID=UPI003879683A
MDNRNRDRGTIKWTSLMLPEHVEMVKQVWKEDERIEKPILDEQKWEEIEFALHRSLNDGLLVEVKYHNGFDFSYFRGKLTCINTHSKTVTLIPNKGSEKATLNINQISDVFFT